MLTQKSCTQDNQPLNDRNTSSLKTKEWLNTKDAAEFLSITEASLRNMVCQRKIIPGKIGRRNRYHIEDLRSLISINEKETSYGL